MNKTNLVILHISFLVIIALLSSSLFFWEIRLKDENGEAMLSPNAVISIKSACLSVVALIYTIFLWAWLPEYHTWHLKRQTYLLEKILGHIESLRLEFTEEERLEERDR